MPLVFQYGSNTSSKRLNSDERLEGDANSLGLARTVENFELTFSHLSKRNKCATAHLQSGVGRKIFGVFYDISEDRVFRNKGGQKKTLDEIEGEGKEYCRTKISVVLVKDPGESFPACTYLVKGPKNSVETNTSYVGYIIAGLREHCAPLEYIEYVKRQAVSNNPSLEPEVQNM
ncbi:MAG: gamma-glutamylcyclotransferase family protein [Nitrospinota bacterium]|nr:gamma-glutamylcyclotransferase family protein [Nitrospinota bacterium]